MRDIVKYKDNLIVCAGTQPPSVKLIDSKDKPIWTVATDRHNQPLFTATFHLTYHSVGKSSTIVVTDGYAKLSLIKAETGEIIARRELKGKRPRGITTDNAGNVFVCYYEMGEVAMFTENLSKEIILLSNKDGLWTLPWAVAYDDMTNQIIVSYFHVTSGDSDKLDCFKLS